VQDEFACVVGLFVCDYFGGQWLSGHSESLCLEFDTDQEEQGRSVIGGGEGVQQGIISSSYSDREYQCEDKGI
jgi:hypothetical protein